MIDAVIFDLDGTLMNTLDDLYYSTNYALKTFGYPERTYEEIRCFVGNGVRVLFEKACPEGINNLDDVLNCFKEHYKVHSMDHIHPYEGMKELLIELKNKGIKTACVTNKFHLAAVGIIEKYYGNLIDMTLGEDPTLRRKPYPDMCNKVIDTLNIDRNNSIYIGDSDVDVMTAANAGLKCVSCSWGFRTLEELKTGGATLIIDKPEKLLDYIE